MDTTDKEFCLEVWGDRACFTRPEFKVERVSYDVITPSAIRGIFEAIFWKPAFRWEVTKIEVLNPIRWTTIRRNEVGAVAAKNKRAIFIEDVRQQKNTLMLSDVRYRVWAKLVYLPPQQRSQSAFKQHAPQDENPMKYYEMFERRARQGQCFHQPYLGTRECAASWRLVDVLSEDLVAPIPEDRDLGVMLYDMNFSNPKNILPMFYHPRMVQGMIVVPPLNDKEILI